MNKEILLSVLTEILLSVAGGAVIAAIGFELYSWLGSWSPHSKHKIFGHEIYVVKSAKFCKWILEKMIKESRNTRWIGFDCEWYGDKPVTLMLAEPKGICVLIRLQEMGSVPEELSKFLKNEYIIKGGIDAVKNAELLEKYSTLRVSSVLDIRNLYNQRDLRYIVNQELGIDLGCKPNGSNGRQLTDEKIEYASGEVIACAKLLARYYDSNHGTIRYFLSEHYFAPYYVDKGYNYHDVTDVTHCKWFIKKLQREISQVTHQTKCVGFECIDEFELKPVGLLLLAGPKSICALIRLKKLDYIPRELIDFLRNPSICKVGITPERGAKYLGRHYGLSVTSYLDIRHLYPRKPNSIIALNRRVIGDWLLRTWNPTEVDFTLPTGYIILQLINATGRAIAAVKLIYSYLERVTMPIRIAELSGSYNLELSAKLAYRNDIPLNINKVYVESTAPHAQHRIFNNDIHVVSGPDHCRWVVSKLYHQIGYQQETNCRMGLDFHSNILHLAHHNGICALILLDHLIEIPYELKELLKNRFVHFFGFVWDEEIDDLLYNFGIEIKNLNNWRKSDQNDLHKETKTKLGVTLGKRENFYNEFHELTDDDIQYCAGKTIACAKLIYAQYWQNSRCLQRIESNHPDGNLIEYCHPDVIHNTFGHSIYIITTTEQCRWATLKIRQITQNCPFVGFDCEWPPWHPRDFITLLQLAGGTGEHRLCVLIRLCLDFEIPQELFDLLNDPTIVKAGVESIRDGQYLAEDYGLNVRGVIDLRHLYPQTSPQQANGLAALAERELGVSLSKDKSISLSGFYQPQLSFDQIQYAAGDAIVGAKLLEKQWLKSNRSLGQMQSFLDKPFRLNAVSTGNVQFIPESSTGGNLAAPVAAPQILSKNRKRRSRNKRK